MCVTIISSISVYIVCSKCRQFATVSHAEVVCLHRQTRVGMVASCWPQHVLASHRNAGEFD